MLQIHMHKINMWPICFLHPSGIRGNEDSLCYRIDSIIKLPCMIGITIGLAPLFLRYQFDHVINTKDGDGCLSCKLDGFCFGHCGLQNTCLFIVSNNSSYQVKSNPVTNHKHVANNCQVNENSNAFNIWTNHATTAPKEIIWLALTLHKIFLKIKQKQNADIRVFMECFSSYEKIFLLSSHILKR